MDSNDLRNPSYNRLGGIDCEVNHPDLGWIPFTAIGDSGDAFVDEVWNLVSVMDDIIAYSPPPVSNSNVTQERDRRILEGVTISLSGVTDPIPLQGSQFDQTVLLGLVQAASLRVANQVPGTVTKFRDAENATHDLSDAQIIELWSSSAAWFKDVMEAAHALKDTPGGIPNNFTDDSHWP